MVKRSKTLEETVLERLAEGELMTVLCRDNAMPSIRQLQRWRRDDAEFDDRCWSAEGRGLMIQRSDYIEQLVAAVKDGGPGSGIQIQGLRELLHENGRTAGRLVARMSDRQSLRIDGQVTHFTVTWEADFSQCPECGYQAPQAIDTPRAINADASHSQPSNGRSYIDHPRRSALEEPATINAERADA
jgi:hypothetical protein